MPQSPLKSPKQLFPKFKGHIQGGISFLYLFGLCLIVNALQVASLLIRPLSLRVFRIINRQLAGFWWGQCVVVAKCFGIGAVISGDQLPKEENAILIANHQDMADIPFIFFVAKSIGRIGDMKWYVKDILKWTPGIGWGMWFIDCIFVKRDWHKDKTNIDKTFSSLTTNKVPCLVISFVEGTRIKPSKIKRAQEFSKAQGLPLFNHVLVPRSKGFNATIAGMREHLDAVYDLTIGYENGIPTLWQYMKGYAKRAHLHVERHPIGKLPQEDRELKQWLVERFSQKEKRLDHFYTHGKMTNN